jgi:hypothetical protein
MRGDVHFSHFVLADDTEPDQLESMISKPQRLHPHCNSTTIYN